MDIETLRDQINGVVEAELKTGEYMKHLPQRAGYESRVDRHPEGAASLLWRF